MTSRTLFQKVETCAIDTSRNYAGVLSSYIYDVRQYYRDISWTGDDRPNWKSLVRNQADATNAYSAYKWRIKLSSPLFIEAEWRAITNADGKWWDSILRHQRFGGPSLTFVQPPPDAVFSSTTALNAAKSRFVQRARAAMSPFKGGVFLGELAETIHLIKRPASSLRQSLTAYLSALRRARRGFKHASKATKSKFLSGSWLEYQYGVLPLLSDIDDGCKALATLLTRTVPTEHVSATGRASQLVSLESLSNRGIEEWRYRANSMRVLKTSYRIEGAVKIAPAGSGSNARHTFGLNVQEFVPTIWELIPYSFLADYFVNIGDIIEAATFCQSNLVWSCLSQKTTETISVSEACSEGSPYTKVSGSVSGGKGEMVAMRFSRQALTSLVPTFQFSLPGLGSTRWVNIAALVAQHGRLVPF
jgi:hypothetical protein